MTFSKNAGFIAALLLGAAMGCGTGLAQPQPGAAPTGQAQAPVETVPAPAATPGALAAGNFSAKRTSPGKFHISASGHVFSSRDAIEKYLAYRAALLTRQQGYFWFEFVGHRVKGDTVPVARPDPEGSRYSFRLEYFTPMWRYTLGAAAKTWSPFRGDAFFANGKDPKTIGSYDVSADIVLHKGMVQDDNPYAFDADAVSDYLINQVAPPA